MELVSLFGHIIGEELVISLQVLYGLRAGQEIVSWVTDRSLGADGRKVRAPEGRIVPNGNNSDSRGSGEGKCHRKQTTPHFGRLTSEAGLKRGVG